MVPCCNAWLLARPRIASTVPTGISEEFSKQEFLLSYLSEPQLRSRIRRGLLKVEQLHALARDVYYGRRRPDQRS